MPEFKDYADHVLVNAKTLAQGFAAYPDVLLTGGTDKHYIVLDVKKAFGIDGETAEKRLESVGILSSRQTLPSDASSKMSEAGGLRLGTAWSSSRGYRAEDFRAIAGIICETLSGAADEAQLSSLKARVNLIATRKKAHDVWGNR